MIRTGTLISNRITTADMQSNYIGKVIAALKGKTTRNPSMQTSESERIIGIIRKKRNLHIHIIFLTVYLSSFRKLNH